MPCRKPRSLTVGGVWLSTTRAGVPGLQPSAAGLGLALPATGLSRCLPHLRHVGRRNIPWSACRRRPSASADASLQRLKRDASYPSRCRSPTRWPRSSVPSWAFLNDTPNGWPRPPRMHRTTSQECAMTHRIHRNTPQECNPVSSVGSVAHRSSGGKIGAPVLPWGCRDTRLRAARDG